MVITNIFRNMTDFTVLDISHSNNQTLVGVIINAQNMTFDGSDCTKR